MQSKLSSFSSTLLLNCSIHFNHYFWASIDLYLVWKNVITITFTAITRHLLFLMRLWLFRPLF